MPLPELKGTLTDIGTEELNHLEMIGAKYHARFQVCVYKAHQTNVVAMKNFLSEKTKDAVQTKNL